MKKNQFWLVLLPFLLVAALIGCKSSADEPERDTKVTVTFNANGGTFSGGKKTMERKVERGQTVEGWPVDPSNSGKTFDKYTIGTDANDPEFSRASTVDSDVTVYAQWVGGSGTWSWTVTFDLNYPGAPAATVVTVRSPDTTVGGQMPTTPTRANTGSIQYTFVGWQINGSVNMFSATSNVGSNITVKAQWTEYDPQNSWKITFDKNNATAGSTDATPSSMPVAKGQALTSLPAPPTRPGYNFAGWTMYPTGGNAFSVTANGVQGTVVTGDTTVYAAWDVQQVDPEIKWKVTFHFWIGDGAPAPLVQENVSAGSNVNLPTVPTRENYSFEAWYSDINYTIPFNAQTPITKDFNVYGKWTFIPPIVAVTWYVDFDGNGGTGHSPSQISVTSDNPNLPSLPTDPSRAGYEFVGWGTTQDGGNQVDVGYTVTDNVTVYAIWYQGPVIDPNVHTHQWKIVYYQLPADAATGVPNDIDSVHFHAGGEEDPSRSSVEIQQVFIAAELGGEPTDRNVLLDLREWNGTPGSGTGGADQPDNPGGPLFFVNFNNPANAARVENMGTQDAYLKIGPVGTYTYMGGFGYQFPLDSGTQYIAFVICSADGVGVRFGLNRNNSQTPSYICFPGGQVGTVPSVNTGAAAKLPIAQIKDYAGGSGGGTSYTVTFNGNGGIPASQTKTVRPPFTTTSLPMNPTRTGFTFTGWYTSQAGGQPFTASTTVISNTTVYAQWNAGGGPGPGPNETSWSKPAGIPLIMAHFMPWHYGPETKSNDSIQGSYGGHWDGFGWKNPTQTEQGQSYVTSANFRKRQIASKVYPLTGPYMGYAKHVVQYQAALMKLSGIDGVLICWYGVSGSNDGPLNNKISMAMADMMGESNGKLAVVLEDWNTPGSQQAAWPNNSSQANIAWLQNGGASGGNGQFNLPNETNPWFRRPYYLKVGDRPLLLNFGPQGDLMANGGAIVGSFNPKPYFVGLAGKSGTWIDSYYPWPTPQHTDPNGSYLDQFYANNGYTRADYKVTSIWPRYDDCYNWGSYDPSGKMRDTTQGTWTKTWGLAYNSGPDVIQIATWNDYGEATVVEPTQEYGYRELVFLQGKVKEMDPTFPFTEEDLHIPLELYKLVYNGTATPAQTASINAAYAALWQGNRTGFRTNATAAGVTWGATDNDLRPIEP